MTKELTQKHNMSVFRLIKQDTHTYDNKKNALLLIMFLKEKRDSSVKACMCANGCKQKDDTWSKPKTMSPTVAMESVFITAVIDTDEGRGVACFDHPGAFLHEDVDECIVMILRTG